MEFIYVTVEDYTNTERLSCIIEELTDSQNYDIVINPLEQTAGYFVVKIEYENFEDVKDVCASITYLLLQYGVISFRMNCAGEDLNEY